MPPLDELVPFTAHNIELRDGRRTVPDKPQLLREGSTMAAIERTLRVVAGPHRRMRIADLGSLEGGYAIELARMGHETVGIEARELNVARAEAVRRELGLTNASFVCDDVKNLAAYGQFDAVYCGGLLYHLDAPFEFLRLLGQVTSELLIINTHYALAADPFYDDPDGRASGSKTDFGLSALTEHEGLAGRWYHEYDDDTPRDEVVGRNWAAFSNSRSFWPTKPALVRACRESGFDVVYEQHDFESEEFVRANDRSMLVCVKSAAVGAGKVDRVVGAARSLVRRVRYRR